MTKDENAHPSSLCPHPCLLTIPAFARYSLMKKNASLFRSAALLAGLCLPMLFTGCAVMDPGSIQSDLNRIKNSQDKLSSKQSEAFLEQQKKLNQIIEELDVHKEMIKAMKADTERQLREMRSTTVAPAAGPVATTPGVAPTPAPSAGDDLLRQGSDAFDKKDYPKTITLVEQYLSQYGDSASAPEAMLRMAISYFHLQNYGKSLDTCSIFIAKYPSSTLLPRAYHTKASCEIQLGKKAEARETLTKLRASFPDYETEKIAKIFTEYLDKR